MNRRARIAATVAAAAGAATMAAGAIGVAASGRPALPAVQPVVAAATPPAPADVRPAAPSRFAGPKSMRHGRRPPAVPSDPPEVVSIPALAVTAPVVERVGVVASGPEKGLLGAPSDFHDLGWYQDDSTGVLLVDGHVGFAAGAGPLAYIGLLQRGDEISVRFARGSRTYVVAAVDRTLKGGLPGSWFTAPYDGWLMLITCDYQSPFHDGHFADNVYVVATPS